VALGDWQYGSVSSIDILSNREAPRYCDTDFFNRKTIQSGWTSLEAAMSPPMSPISLLRNEPERSSACVAGFATLARKQDQS